MQENQTLNRFSLITTIVFTLLSIYVILHQLNWIPSFGEPNWEGSWEMRIGRNGLGETKTFLRYEGGYLIGAYVIQDKNSGQLLVSEMRGVVSNDRLSYNGDWIQTSRGILQNKGEFSLIMSNKNTISGSYYVKTDSTRSDNSPWYGEKIHSIF